MANIYEEEMDITKVPQGWTLAAAFSTDMNWTRLPGILNKLFNITERDSGYHEVGSVAKIDNLYMLFAKESSYEDWSWEALDDALTKLAKKIKKKNIKHLAMPKICTGRGGFNWGEVEGLIEDKFRDIDVDIMICYQ